MGIQYGGHLGKVFDVKNGKQARTEEYHDKLINKRGENVAQSLGKDDIQKRMDGF